MNDEQLKKWRDSLPEEVPTAEERDAINKAKQQFANGEYIQFSSAEEMKAYFLNDDEETEG